MAVSRKLIEVVRYYQAGIVNTVFGLGCYALLIRLGMGIYAAQLVAHLIGMGFNYFTYSRHVFRDAGPAKMRFFLSYLVNYFISLAVLAMVARIVASPYLAGIFSAIVASVINYFALKFLVFRARPA